jgi:hypothetical protein
MSNRIKDSVTKENVKPMRDDTVTGLGLSTGESLQGE